MPSKSKAQRNLMAAAAHNPAFAKKVGIPVSVAKEFNAADKGKKFSMGGKLQSRGNAPGLTRSKSGTKSGITQVQGGQDQINKQETRWGSIFGQSKGVPNTTLNKYVGHKEGGKIMAKANLKSLFKGKESYGEELKEAKAIKSGKITPEQYAKGEKMEGHKKGGCVKMAGGGVTRADGCIMKGHTKGKMV